MPRGTAKEEFEQHRSRSTRNPEEEILKRFRNSADVESIARRLPTGSKVVSKSGSVENRVNSILVTAKANDEPEVWAKNVESLIFTFLPKPPEAITGFPEGTLPREAERVRNILGEKNLEFLLDKWQSSCNSECDPDPLKVAQCGACIGSGLPPEKCTMNWKITPGHAKEINVANLLARIRKGETGKGPTLLFPTHICAVNKVSCQLSAGCSECSEGSPVPGQQDGISDCPDDCGLCQRSCQSSHVCGPAQWRKALAAGIKTAKNDDPQAQQSSSLMDAVGGALMKQLSVLKQNGQAPRARMEAQQIISKDDVAAFGKNAARAQQRRPLLEEHQAALSATSSTAASSSRSSFLEPSSRAPFSRDPGGGSSSNAGGRYYDGGGDDAYEAGNYYRRGGVNDGDDDVDDDDENALLTDRYGGGGGGGGISSTPILKSSNGGANGGHIFFRSHA